MKTTVAATNIISIIPQIHAYQVALISYNYVDKNYKNITFKHQVLLPYVDLPKNEVKDSQRDRKTYFFLHYGRINCFWNTLDMFVYHILKITIKKVSIS